jgi:predicted  nucleic acid-binding Zn-ribbon protein
LCDDLLKKISDSLDLERKNFNNYVDEYTRQITGLTDKLGQVEGEITDLSSEIYVLNKRINMISTEKQD